MLRPPPRRLFALAALVSAFAAVNCAPDITGPDREAVRYARGISFQPVFPAILAQTSAQVVPFTRVRILINHLDGSVALDTVVEYPPNATELTLSLDVRLSAAAPPSGEPLELNLAYVNAAGDTVFRGGPTSIVAIPTIAGAPPPPPVDVTLSYTGPGSLARQVVITPRTLSVFGTDPFAFTAVAQDGAGIAIPGTPIVFTVTNTELAQLTSPSAGAGVGMGRRGSTTVKAQLLTGPSDVATLNVQPRPSVIAAISGSQQSGQAGSNLTQSAVAQVRATDGIGVAGATVTFVPSGNGTASPATAVTDADGFASTTWKLATTAGSQTLTASTAAIAGQSAVFVAVATSGTAVKLAVVTQPTSTTAGGNVGPVVLAAQDANNNVVTTFTGSVTVALGSNPTGAALGGTTTANAVQGVATFSELSLNKAGTGYTLSGTSTGLTAATSAPFNIGAGIAQRLEITTQPSNGVAGTPLAATVVTARDAIGNVAVGFNGPVVASLAANPNFGILGGTTTVNAVAGVATFSNLVLAKAGTGYALGINSTGFSGEFSVPFNVLPGAPVACVAVSGDNQTGIAGLPLPAPVIVSSVDALNNAIPGVAVGVEIESGGGLLGAATAEANAVGEATIAWTLGGTPGPQSLRVTCPGVATPLTISATGIPGVAGPATQLAFTTGPSNVTAGTVNTPPITVTARDVFGLVATTFTGTVTLSIGTNPGGSTTIGTLTAPAVAGVATFSDIRLNKTGVGYTLIASAAPLTPATSAGFNVTAAPAISIVADSGNEQIGPINVLLPVRLVARVLDSLGNGVPGANVTLAVESGGGGIAPSGSLVTDVNGRVRTNWTLGPLGGAQTVTATSVGLGGSPVTFTATGTGGPISIVWTGAIDGTWNTPGNWTPAQVPTAVDSVTIQSAPFSPAISTPVTVRDLVVRQCADVSNSSTLTVTRHMIDSSQFCGGVGTTGGALRAAGPSRTRPWGAGLSRARPVLASNVGGAGTIVLSGTGNLMGHFAASAINLTGGTHTLVGTTLLNASTTVSGAARLNLGGFFLQTEDFTTSGSGTLQMDLDDSAGDLDIVGNATFGGGSLTGLLTEGTITVFGNFSASGASFDAEHDHTLAMAGCIGTQTLNFTAPVAGHGIQHLFFDCSAPKTITGTPTVLGNLEVGSSSAAVQGPAATVLVRGDLLDNADLSGSGWIVANTHMDSNGEIGGGSYQTNLTIINGTVTLESDDFIEILGNVTITGAASALEMTSTTLAVAGNFSTLAGGRLMMGSSDFLDIGGNATFAGGSTAGLMPAGLINVLGNFTQAGAADAFAPGIGHTTNLGHSDLFGAFLRAGSRASSNAAMRASAQTRTPSRLTGRAGTAALRALDRAAKVRADAQAKTRTAHATKAVSAAEAARKASVAKALARVPTKRLARVPQAKPILANSEAAVTVTFANPGLGAGTSHFGVLVLSSDQMDLASNASVDGPIIADDDASHLIAGTSRVLTTRGAVVFDVQFDNVRWVLLDGSSVVQLQLVRFSNMDPTVNQFTVQRPGDPGDMAPLVQWTFETVPTTGNYISATDIDGASPHPLFIDMQTPSPGTSGGFIQLINGAITNWVSAFQWIGLGSSASWNDAGNWNTESIPGPFDDVVIRNTAPQSPIVDDDAGALAHHLTIENGTSIELEFPLLVFGDLIAPVNAESVICTGGSAVDLIGDGGINNVVGWLCSALVTGNYSVAGPGNQLIVTSFLEILGAGANLTLNGGRVDVGGPGGLLGSGIFQTASGGTLTMNNVADQMYVGGIGAFFDGGSTSGRLTNGTFTLFATVLRTSAGGAPDAYAPSGNHKTVFTGSNEVDFFNPTASKLHNAELVANAEMTLMTDAMVTGTLAHTGTGTAEISSSDAGLLQTLRVSGLSNTQPLIMSSIAIEFVNGTPNATFNNVTWEDFGSNFTGNVFDVNRSDAGTLTFTNHNFLDLELGTGGHYLVNRGSANVHMATPQPGTVSPLQVQQIGTGTIIWP